MNNQPIGIIDSGIGGISVWKEVAMLLPHESLVYAADQARLPYGSKTSSQIHSYAGQLVQFLTEHQVKAVIIACNTMTVHAIDVVRSQFPELPIIGTVPAIKKAVEISSSKKIGILSTISTARSPYQAYLLEEFAGDCDVETIGTDALVPLVESLGMPSQVVAKTVKAVLKPFQEHNCDTIVLGCTHFPFLKDHIQKVMGKEVCIIDSGEAIARQVQRVLLNNKSLASKTHNPSHSFYTTGEKKAFEKLLASLLGKEHVRGYHIENLVFPKK